MMDDIDRECCASVEAALKIGIKPTYWNIIDREFHDPGASLLLQWIDSTGKDVRQPKVKVRIDYVL